MASLKFNHAFTLMMSVCAATALFLPDGATAPVKNAFASLFAPVASPVHTGSSWLENRVRPISSRPDPNAPAGNAELAAENAELKVTILSLSQQLEDLKKLNADRDQLGDLRKHSVPARVVGLDAGTRQMLQVEGAGGVLFAEGMPAITTRGFVGRVVGGFRGAARVRLITDSGSKVVCRFVRLKPDEAGRLTQQEIQGAAPLVVGTGEPTLRITNLSQSLVEQTGITVGDCVVVNDEEFMPTYQGLIGFLVGRVTAINKSKINPLMADLTVEPPVELRRLKEVMIVAK